MPFQTRKGSYRPRTPRQKKFSNFRKFNSKQKFGVKADVMPEIKFVETGVSVQPANTGAVLLLNGCTLGTDALTNRIGRKIQMTSVDYLLNFAASTADLGTAGTYAEGTDTLKLSLVYDKQSNGAAPTYADIYQSANPFSHRNINYLDRFIVLSEELVAISAAGPNGVCTKKYIRMKHDVRFNAGNAGTVADITSGALYLVYGDSNSAGTQQATLLGQVRCRYRDT